MEIEWVTFVESVEGEGIDMVLKAPGSDSVLAKWLPADISIWAVVSLRVNYQELVHPETNTLCVDVRDSHSRQLVNRLQFVMAAPTIESPTFHEGHSGRVVKSFEIDFQADLPGWYEVDFTFGERQVYPMVLFVGESR
jgi:hypothetical protein